MKTVNKTILISSVVAAGLFSSAVIYAANCQPGATVLETLDQGSLTSPIKLSYTLTPATNIAYQGCKQQDGSLSCQFTSVANGHLPYGDAPFCTSNHTLPAQIEVTANDKQFTISGQMLGQVGSATGSSDHKFVITVVRASQIASHSAMYKVHYPVSSEYDLVVYRVA